MINVNSNIKKSIFLVTGGAGFIGSNITENLVKNKAKKVIVLDNLSYGKKDNLKFDINKNNIEFIKGDIRNFELLMELTKDVDYVSHHAALRSVPESIKKPDLYNEVNVRGTLNVLMASHRNHVKRVIFASSSSVYGERNIFPGKEEDNLKPISPYACSKLIGENYCSLFTNCYGLDTISFRYFNVFGPRQSLENKYAVVIPKFIISLLENKATPIFGDGHQERDFICVDNVSDINLNCFFINNGAGEIYNIGSGHSLSILDLSNKLQKLIGVEINPEFLPPRKGDVKKTLSDITKAKKKLKYNVKVPLEEGLIKTIEWFRKNKTLVKLK